MSVKAELEEPEFYKLILKNRDFFVTKDKLEKKSRYFASLFSHNFNDSHSMEHIINYDINFCTLQNFVDWIDCESAEHMCSDNVKFILKKYVKANFRDLLNLLQLSVLFMVDELTNDIVDLIILHWLLPAKLIDIWLLARDLNIKTLQDVCFSVCLDRFIEIPVSRLTELTKDNILQLITNVNVRSNRHYLAYIRYEWIKYHKDPEIETIKNVDKQVPIQGTVIYEINDDDVKIPYVYLWNGNVLSKCVELKIALDSGKSLIGMQVASRGFSIYTIGGEWGLGTGQFNDIIWRYCLLSKKWYYQSRLPSPRRHMVAAFLENQLVIVGGIGRHRLKLFTVDVLNIHTGQWETGAKVPESFTEVPPYCVLKGKLFLLKSSIYVFNVEENYWQTILLYNNPAALNVEALLTPTSTVFLIGTQSGKTVFSSLNMVTESTCEKEECRKGLREHRVIPAGDIVHLGNSYDLRHTRVGGIGILTINIRRPHERQYIHIRKEIRKDFDDYTIPKLGCLNLLDPHTLYDRV